MIGQDLAKYYYEQHFAGINFPAAIVCSVQHLTRDLQNATCTLFWYPVSGRTDWISWRISNFQKYPGIWCIYISITKILQNKHFNKKLSSFWFSYSTWVYSVMPNKCLLWPQENSSYRNYSTSRPLFTRINITECELYNWKKWGGLSCLQISGLK